MILTPWTSNMAKIVDPILPIYTLCWDIWAILLGTLEVPNYPSRDPQYHLIETIRPNDRGTLAGLGMYTIKPSGPSSCFEKAGGAPK